MIQADQSGNHLQRPVSFCSHFQSVAIIETNEAHGVYGDEPKAAWVVLTSLKVVLGLRVTARSLTPGNMDLDIKVAGPYGFYDPLPAAKSSLSCDAEAALTLLANYVTPEMLDAPLQVLMRQIYKLRRRDEAES